MPRRHSTSKHRDFSNRVYASDEARAEATERAEELESGLGSDHPTFVKPMLQSHVTGGFWLVNKSLFFICSKCHLSIVCFLCIGMSMTLFVKRAHDLNSIFILFGFYILGCSVLFGF